MRVTRTVVSCRVVRDSAAFSASSDGTSFVKPVISYSAKALVRTNTSGSLLFLVAARKYVSKPAMGATNTLDPDCSFAVAAANPVLVIAKTADTTTRDANMRLNIGATFLG